MKFESRIFYLSITALILVFVNLFLVTSLPIQNGKVNVIAKLPANSTPTSTPTPVPTPTPTSTPTVAPTPTSVPLKIIFGIGSQAGPAMDYKLVKEAPVHMLSSWYNSTDDLTWMRVQQNDLIPRLYKNHYIVHLITWTDGPAVPVDTPHGPACGRPYPVGTQILDDMKQLAQIYNGPGPMYVTLFTEFPDYTCDENSWNGNENYWNTLKDNFRKIKDIFHQYAPNSKVAMSWGGFMSTYDDPGIQAGLSFIPHFDDVMRESDFTSFQSMESDTNVDVWQDMTKILSKFKKPIMVSHYKPANGSQAVFDDDMKKLFTDDVMRQLIKNGLFAFSFMDSEQIDNSDGTYQIVKSGIQKYGK